MLEEVLRYINNRFDRDKNGTLYGYADGEFSISNGSLELEDVLAGQYFWVEGSVLNDGLHQYPDTEMQDETFNGRIYKLVIPKAVVDLAQEVSDWCTANAGNLNGPYQSESFGGYSYSLKGSSSNGEVPASAWQVQFGARLRPYRKISRDWV